MLKRLIFLLLFCLQAAQASESECYGTTASGRLERGVELPSEGPNFVAYSTIARLAGRTYVHSRVRNIVLSAYEHLEVRAPGKVYKYAETGFEEGGQFQPHKTHQNGLSVDFMVPVTNAEGQSVHLPTHPYNKFGYNIEFDDRGRYEALQLDYDAMGAHIVELHKAALEEGVDLWRVIFDPVLQPFLLRSRHGEYLRQHIQFSRKRSWVRHDEHYHVDFAIPCRD
ncbi:MAG: penicillin-insensitive murein endopeptidase [Marinobacter sp.]|nr:penicillin-insensitive murein endopeptidase [Marinobacter sp.]